MKEILNLSSSVDVNWSHQHLKGGFSVLKFKGSYQKRNWESYISSAFVKTIGQKMVKKIKNEKV